MLKKISVIFLALLFIGNSLYAQNVGDSKLFWVHNNQFFQYDYKIGATLHTTGDHCNVWVENNLVTATIVDDVNGYVYAGTKYSGVFRKPTNGTEWTAFSDGWPNSGFLDGLSRVHQFLLTDNNTLLAATDDGLLLYDTESARWRRRSIAVMVNSLIQKDGVLFAALGGHLWSVTDDNDQDDDDDNDIDHEMGVYVSTDDGQNWVSKSDGLPFDDERETVAVYDLAIANGYVFATTDFGVFRTNNNGEFWEGSERSLVPAVADIKVNLEYSSISEQARADAGIGIGPNYENLLRVPGISGDDKVVVVEYDDSNNVKTRWFCAADSSTDTNKRDFKNAPGIVGDEGYYTLNLSFYTRDPSTPFVADYSVLDINNFKYRNEPATATIIDPEKELLISISYPGDLNFEVGGKFVTVKYENDGQTWVWSLKSVPLRGLNNEKKGLYLNNNNLISGTPITNYDELNYADIISNFQVTTTIGTIFQKIVSVGDNDVLVAGNETGIYVSTDTGITWTEEGVANEGLEDTEILSMTSSGSSTVYVGTMEGLYKSVNSGSSWELLESLNQIDELASFNVYCVSENNGTLYIGTPYGYYASSDGGTTWNNPNFGMVNFISNDEIENVVDVFENTTPKYANKGVYQVITENFGESNLPDFDKNSKIDILLHNIIDQGIQETATSNGNTGTTPIYGYIRPEDQNQIGNTNKADILYIDTVEANDFQRGAALAHQLLRLLIWNMDYDEERWIVEGMSFLAERYCGYPLPRSMPDFQSTTGAATVFSLIAGIPSTPWAVAPDDGNMNNRYSMVTMFVTYLYENFGGLDFIKEIMLEEENGWRGIQNALSNPDLKFDDIYASWAVANCINDITKTDPITGAKYGYTDSTYSQVLENYKADKVLGMNWGRIYGHDQSMKAFDEYTAIADYGEGLNNWAYFIRYFFPNPGVTDPVQAVVDYWGADRETGEPINYVLNARDYANLKVHLIKVTPEGDLDVENITSTFNDEKELSFNVLSKYEPNADTTQLKYHNMYILISNQDSLGRAVKMVQVRDNTPPEIYYEVVHNPIYPEFLDIFVSSNEHTFYDVAGELQNPTVEMVYFTDTTSVQMELFDVGEDTSENDALFVYKGRYVLTEDGGKVDLILRKLQDLPGNDSDEINQTFNLEKAIPHNLNKIANAENTVKLTIPEYSLSSETMLSLISYEPEKSLSLHKSIKSKNFKVIDKLYQFGPTSQKLLKKAQLSINYNDNGVDEEQIGLYYLENSDWVPVTANLDIKNNTINASVEKLGVYAVIQGNVNTINNTDSMIPTTFAMYQNYPNPFNPTTEINFQLPKSENVTIKVFNMNGQLVKTLLNEIRDAGHHQVRWNGLNNNGTKVSSGVYFYEMKAADYTETKKMVLIK